MIKREINLRTREFAIAREFYWPRVFTTLGVLFLIALLAGGSFFLYLHRLNLESDVAFLETEKVRLEAAVAPIDQMEAEIREMRTRLDVDIAFSAQYIPWSAHLGDVVQLAGEGGIAIDSISCPDATRMNMRGSGPSMRRIVLFVESLEEQEFLYEVKYTVMALQQDRFSYDIIAAITRGGSE